jgi:hypothetical protein
MSRAGNVKLSQNPKLGLVVLVLDKGGHRSPFAVRGFRVRSSEFGVRGSEGNNRANATPSNWHACAIRGFEPAGKRFEESLQGNWQEELLFDPEIALES